MTSGPLQALTEAQASRANAAFALLGAGRAAEALPIARALAADAPRAADAHQLLGLCHGEAGALADAEHAFRRALELAPRHPQILSNYARLLRKHGRIQDAVGLLRKAVRAAPGQAAPRTSLVLALLEIGEPAQACEVAEAGVAAHPGDGALWLALGRARLVGEQLEGAVAAFGKATELMPGDAGGWIGLGNALRLLGNPSEAVERLGQAARSGLDHPDLLSTLAGALTDCGRPEDAKAQARRLIERHPGYAPGHLAFAHLEWEYGSEDPLAALVDAVREQPGNGPLQLALIGFLLESGRAEEALARLEPLRARGDHPLLCALQANALELLDRPQHAASLYATAHRALGDSDPSFLNAYTRHLLRAGQWDAAAARATDATRVDPLNQEAWAYLGTAWRLLGDEREHWLCDYERLVAMVEVEPPDGFADQDGFLAALRATLEPMHQAHREPVHQSLRGGSQTPGRLFGRPDPMIDTVRRALLHAIERHIATLPDDPRHPFLARRRRSVRYTGSWSVKLWSSGRHVNHIHPEGWMSSAYYVSLPPSVREPGRDQPGSIQFGQPPLELGLKLAPRRILQPRPGHVALFPSYMWHGTVPFADDEPRMTIAFDMVPSA